MPRASFAWALPLLASGALPCTGCDRLRDAGSETAARPRPFPVADASIDQPPAVDAVPTVQPPELVDAGQALVELGVAPTAAQLLDAGYVDLATLADAQVVSLGVRAVSFAVGWSDWVVTYSPQVVLDDAEVSVWRERLRSYTRAGVAVVFSLAFVDRMAPLLPTGITGFDQAAAVSVGQAVIDAVYDQLGDQVTVLAFGREVDRYLAVASAASRDTFASFLLQLGDYARAHRLRPAGLRLGLWASADGWLLDVEGLSALAGTVDVPLSSFYPFDAESSALPVPSALARFAALREVLTQQVGYSELVFPEVAYPSAPEAGSSEQQQADFYQALLETLANAERPVILQVQGLHDPDSDACLREAASFGPASGQRTAWLCSVGLRRSDATPKPAFDAVRRALADFHRE